jgi:hypothetical protein
MGRVHRSVGAAALLAAVLAGCGDDHPDAAQPVPDATVFDEVGFEELPRFPRSEEMGLRSSKAGVVTQSFRAEGASVERVMAFFEEALTGRGWLPAEPIHRADGPGRADYVREDDRLELSAIDVDDRDGDVGAEAVVQYSLLLRPA